MSGRESITNKGKALSIRFADKYGVEQKMLMTTLKQTAFRQRGAQVTDEQMVSLLVVADQYGLNPFTREIYAFPDSKSGGIVPVVGVDGWNRIINEHPEFDGMEFRQSEDWEDHKQLDGALPCPDWMECIIYRKDRTKPIVIREYLDECYRPPFNTKNGKVSGPWQSHTKRFLRHKVLIQAGRISMGFAGIYDEDEAKRIREVEAHVSDIQPSKPFVAMPSEKKALPKAGPVQQNNKIDLEQTGSGELTQEAFENITANYIVGLDKRGIPGAKVQAAFVKAGMPADHRKAKPEEYSQIVDILEGMLNG